MYLFCLLLLSKLHPYTACVHVCVCTCVQKLNRYPGTENESQTQFCIYTVLEKLVRGLSTVRRVFPQWKLVGINSI